MNLIKNKIYYNNIECDKCESETLNIFNVSGEG